MKKDKLLKGNYNIDNQDQDWEKEQRDSYEVFEDKALERLGGSIAFVMKGKSLMWDDDEDE